MRILFLTQYFPPETGAPQNRIHSLALHLANMSNEITILTAMPNYPKMRIFEGYRRKFYVSEKVGPLTLQRSWIYSAKNKGPLFRLLNYFSFTLSAILIGLIKVKRQDVLICESPPLFLGITALILSKTKKAKLIFNVSDLWPESVEKLGIIKNKFILGFAYKLERLIYFNSSLVTGQTQGIIDNIRSRFPDIDAYWLSNGIDLKQFDTNADQKTIRDNWGIPTDAFVLLYAGIFGYAQGLEIILSAADNLRDYPNIKFVLVGDGPERSKLEEIAKKRNLANTIFMPNQRGDLIAGIIASCDAYIVPLKKLDLFLGAVPSKIFEPLAMGKPIILGVDGESRKRFIEEGNCGLYYEPENCSELIKCILSLEKNKNLANHLGENGRKYVREYYDREKIAEDFHKVLVQLTN